MGSISLGDTGGSNGSSSRRSDQTDSSSTPLGTARSAGAGSAGSPTRVAAAAAYPQPAARAYGGGFSYAAAGTSAAGRASTNGGRTTTPTRTSLIGSPSAAAAAAAARPASRSGPTASPGAANPLRQSTPAGLAALRTSSGAYGAYTATSGARAAAAAGEAPYRSHFALTPGAGVHPLTRSGSLGASGRAPGASEPSSPSARAGLASHSPFGVRSGTAAPASGLRASAVNPYTPGRVDPYASLGSPARAAKERHAMTPGVGAGRSPMGAAEAAMRRSTPAYESLSPGGRAIGAFGTPYSPAQQPGSPGSALKATPGSSGSVARVLAANGQPRKVPAAMLGQLGSARMASLLEG